MKGIALVAAAGLLSAAIFLAWRKGAPSSDDAFAAAGAGAASIIAGWLERGVPPEQRIMTLVLALPEAGPEAITLADPPRKSFLQKLLGRPDDSFAQAFERLPDSVLCRMAVLPTAQSEPRVAPFARILVKAGDAGGRVRVIAQGRTAALAAEAALAATRPGRPAVERLVAIGVDFAGLEKSYPGLVARVKAAGPESSGEWHDIWFAPEKVPRTFMRESWIVGTAQPAVAEYAWEQTDAWPEIVLRVWQGGASAKLGEALAAAEPITAPSQSGRRSAREAKWRAPKESGALDGSLEMLRVTEKKAAEQASAPPPPPNAAGSKAVITKNSIADTGWVFLPPPGFRRFDEDGNTQFSIVWSKKRAQGFDIRLGHNYGSVSRAATLCGEQKLAIQEHDHRGYKAELCAGLSWVDGGREDVITILSTLLGGKGRTLDLEYNYPEGRREDHAAEFMVAVEALRPGPVVRPP